MTDDSPELPSSIQEVGEGVGQIKVNLQKLDGKSRF